jgi:hypothetical protein
MNSERRSLRLLLVLVVALGGACVQSSGFEEPPAAANAYTIDGARQDFTLVAAERRGDGFDFADRRTLRVSGVRGSGFEGFFINVPADLSTAEKSGDLVPNGVVAAELITGDNDDEFFFPVAGTYAVSGGFEIGDEVVIAIEGATFRPVCNGGSDIAIDDFNITATVTAADLNDGVGFSGHAILDTVEDGATVPRILNVVLPVEDGAGLLIVATAVGCFETPARQLVIEVPSLASFVGTHEQPANAGGVRFTASLVDTATFDAQQAPAAAGTITVSARDEDTFVVDIDDVVGEFPAGADVSVIEMSGAMVVELGHPVDLLEGCQGVTPQGLCLGNTAEFCSSDDTLVRLDCSARDAVCAEISDEYGVDCLLALGDACIDDGQSRGVCPRDSSCIVGAGIDGTCESDPGATCRRNEVGACVDGQFLSDCGGVIAQDLDQGVPLYVDCAGLGSTCSDGVGCVVASGEPCEAPALCAGGAACPASQVCP